MARSINLRIISQLKSYFQDGDIEEKLIVIIHE
jgi:hypothetical protein